MVNKKCKRDSQKQCARRIIILRHAQTVAQTAAVKGYAIGHSYVPLSQDGRAQAHAFSQVVQRLMKDRKPLDLYSSPSQRALESFGSIALYNYGNIAVLPNFQEIFLGDWEGKRFTDIKAQWPDLYEERGKNMAHFRPPYGESFGESFQDVQDRMLMAIQMLAWNRTLSKRPALVMSHAGCIRTVLCHCLHIPLENIMQLKVDNLHGVVLNCTVSGEISLVAKDISGMNIADFC